MKLKKQKFFSSNVVRQTSMLVAGLLVLSAALAFYTHWRNAQTLSQAAAKAAKTSLDQVAETLRRYQYGFIRTYSLG